MQLVKMSKSEKKRSIVSNPRRRSSNKKSPPSSFSIQEDSASFVRSIHEESTSIIQTEKLNINYQDEIVLIFFNSMLEVIVKEWKPLLETLACKCSGLFKGRSTLELPSEYSLLIEQASIAEEISKSRCSILPSMMSSQGLIKKKQWSKSRGSKRDSMSQKSRTSSLTHSLNINMKMEGYRSPLRSNSLDESMSLLPPSQDLDWILECPDEVVSIKFKNGNRYKGPVSKKLMNGYGKFIWADGSIFEGDFQRGSATGKGYLQLPDLSTYEGEFFKNRLHGEGVFKPNSTEIIYSGQWKSGLQHGRGWLSYEAGNSYTGEWVNGLRHGRGVYVYKTGDKYSGDWFEGQHHGFGVMVWKNNDFYKGSWALGHMQGYGEYTWNTFLNKTLTYPIQTFYNGNWANSMRNGVGTMNFGTDGGAWLAAEWKNNSKHGAGVVICDNGAVVERNPLFCCDNSISLDLEGRGYKTNPLMPSAADISCLSAPHSIQSLASKLSNMKSHFRLLPDQLSARVEDESLTHSVLNKISQSVHHSGAQCYHDHRSFEFNHLWVPIHSPPEQQNFTYYINLCLTKYFHKLYKTEWLKTADQHGEQNNAYGSSSKYSKWNIQHVEGSNIPKYDQLSLNSTDIEIRLMTYQTMQLSVEEKYIKNALTVYLPRLYSLYYKLFLWQMLRDLQIQEITNYSLVELDEILWENGTCGLENLHNPFEKIYFWQFLNIVLTLAWITHNPKNITNECKTKGLLATILKHFVVEIIEKHTRITYGCSLFAYKDVVPINSVYNLYIKLGEPITAREFMYKVCLRKGLNPPCYLRAYDDQPAVMIEAGSNVVALAGLLIYLPMDPPEIGTVLPEPYPEFKQDDVFRKQLYALRAVGPRKVVECLVTVCPKIVQDGVIANMEYKLSFIEFYDVLLMCTFAAVDVAKKSQLFSNWLEERKLESSVSKIAIESSRLSRIKERRRSSKVEI